MTVADGSLATSQPSHTRMSSWNPNRPEIRLCVNCKTYQQKVDCVEISVAQRAYEDIIGWLCHNCYKLIFKTNPIPQ